MQPEKKVFMFLKSALTSIFENKIILLPFLTIAFFQLLIIEILYFYPRFPLNVFFEPLVTEFWSPIYMHYPNNLMFLPKLFQTINGFLYILISSFLICVSIHMIGAINHGQKATMKAAIKNVLSRYVHIFIAAIIIFLMIWGLHQCYELVLQRALKIRSETGKFYMLKKIIFNGAPYFSLLISIFSTAFWAYLYPLIAVEKLNIFKAVLENFRILWRSFLFTFFIVFWPTLAGCSLLMLRSTKLIAQNPEFSIFLFALGVLIIAVTDALMYTALTVYFLTWKEARKDQQ